MDALLQLDSRILLWIQEAVRTDFLTPIFRFITTLGDGGMIWIILALIFLCSKKYKKVGVAIALALIGSLVFNNLLLKNIVGRIRPYEVIEELTILIEKPGEFSFPSGHTGSSFAAAAAIFLGTPRKIGIPALVLAFFIGISRLYVGVHYPTDVLGGMITGTILAIGAYNMVKKLEFWWEQR